MPLAPMAAPQASLAACVSLGVVMAAYIAEGAGVARLGAVAVPVHERSR